MGDMTTRHPLSEFLGWVDAMSVKLMSCWIWCRCRAPKHRVFVESLLVWVGREEEVDGARDDGPGIPHIPPLLKQNNEVVMHLLLLNLYSIQFLRAKWNCVFSMWMIHNHVGFVLSVRTGKCFYSNALVRAISIVSCDAYRENETYT